MYSLFTDTYRVSTDQYCLHFYSKNFKDLQKLALPYVTNIPVEEVGKEKVSNIPESWPLSQSMLFSCFQTITDKIAMITFQHKKEKAFCLKNESVFPGFIQQSGRGEVRRESVSNERTGGRMGRELGLTEMAAPPLSFLLSPAFSDSSGSV